MSITGSWNVRMKTPIGGIHAVFTFVDTNGTLTGTAASGGDVSEMRDLITTPQPDGSTALSWAQSVKKPMRLNLQFDVNITGDALRGYSKAGKLPKTPVEGSRA